MSTYNILSLFSFDKFLKDVLDIKKEFGGHHVKQIPLILDTPYLRYPPHQSVFIMPSQWKQNILNQLTFIENNLESPTPLSKANNGFYQWEADKFRRIYELVSNLDNATDTEITKEKQDFVVFVDEHDRRRGTDFLKTFPEMADTYYKWKANF
jgi:hypothetical protein